MATGACGINCDVCRLSLTGVCSTCGPGNSREGRRKAAAQVRILGAPCPILECASNRGIAYCLSDCGEFPCASFHAYPYSEGFLKMQERRRSQPNQILDPIKAKIQVPVEYWEEIEKKEMSALCENALAEAYTSEDLVLSVLGRQLLVDRKGHALRGKAGEEWQAVSNPLLELLTLVYLLHAGPHCLSQDLISLHELKTAHFFQGPHELNLDGLLLRFGRDLEGFGRAAESLGGERRNLADAAYRIAPFPKVPLYYLLWQGDEEFDPRVSVLFDRTVEKFLSADALWGLVNLVTDALLRAPEPPF